jgi:hypothetical protein
MSNEETKKAADELVEVFSKATPYFLSYTSAIHHAIASTENTIKVLGEISNKIYEDSGFTPIDINKSANEQAQILNELKKRL